jgi:hypothetical protein
MPRCGRKSYLEGPVQAEDQLGAAEAVEAQVLVEVAVEMCRDTPRAFAAQFRREPLDNRECFWRDGVGLVIRPMRV